MLHSEPLHISDHITDHLQDTVMCWLLCFTFYYSGTLATNHGVMGPWTDQEVMHNTPVS